jgi:hypothetical protein
MATNSDDIERCAKYPVPPDVLLDAMIRVAGHLCTMPDDDWLCSATPIGPSITQLSRVERRAIWEHYAERRVSYNIIPEEGGIIRVEAWEGLPEWWCEQVTGLPTAGYLGLIVDEARGEVRREVKDADGCQKLKVVEFETDSAEWRTFLVAYHAGEQGATNAEWERGYPGDWPSRRKRKQAAGEKLARLNVRFTKGSLRLESL